MKFFIAGHFALLNKSRDSVSKEERESVYWVGSWLAAQVTFQKAQCPHFFSYRFHLKPQVSGTSNYYNND